MFESVMKRSDQDEPQRWLGDDPRVFRMMLSGAYRAGWFPVSMKRDGAYMRFKSVDVLGNTMEHSIRFVAERDIFPMPGRRR